MKPQSMGAIIIWRRMIFLELGKQIVETIKAHLKKRAILMNHGMIIDATLVIASNCSQNNKVKTDPGRYPGLIQSSARS